MAVALHGFVCPRCGAKFRSRFRDRIYCSRKCKSNGRAPADPAERFWSHVTKGAGCWEWKSVTRSTGYGAFRVGRLGVDRRYVVAHRYAWELTSGPIPAGLFVLHRCDNRLCVRPEHLFLGTALDNSRDMYSKGREPPQNRRRRLPE